MFLCAKQVEPWANINGVKRVLLTQASTEASDMQYELLQM